MISFEPPYLVRIFKNHLPIYKFICDNKEELEKTNETLAELGAWYTVESTKTETKKIEDHSATRDGSPD